ncbi:vWA domain-containing protein [Crossiella cryophila]|uniref:Ca-activated chloride channel family protein n=1 Tax=Crossiella cryophila TaxID=43355 RepID=A0A7W7CD22_9PSEU|nr:VWA domain-containing protein [Crossiella cryophila]MBB4678885.1 Ca-activated chloride channel family protein [Crossiella cryophila]
MRRLLAAGLVLGLVAGCAGSGPEPVTLSVLASSELADLAPVLAELKKDTGIDLAMDYRGTVEASNSLTPGQYKHDLAWLSSDRFFQLRTRKTGTHGPAPLATRTMLSPLVVGLPASKARKLRDSVPGGQPTWADLAARAAAGEFRFGMADPHITGSGLAALIGVATAAAGTGVSLRPEDVACDKLRGFFTGRAFTAQSTPALTEEYVKRQGEVDAIVSYESVLLSLQTTGKLKEPLELIYPRDGIVLADYPLLLLDNDKRAAYDRLTEWLRSERVQRLIMERTARRPIDPALSRTEQLRPEIGNSLYFPDRQEVVDTLLAAYDRATSGAGRQVVFVLDFSASMAGSRIEALRAAFKELSGAGGFDRFHRGETITVLRFAGQVLEEKTVTVSGPGDLDTVNRLLATEELGKGTAIWSALDHAYRTVKGEASIVLMTDGENNAGISLADFLRNREHAPEGKSVRTYAIRFGTADPVELTRAAQATGGRMVDAAQTSLLAAVKEIRGCG